MHVTRGWHHSNGIDQRPGDLSGNTKSLTLTSKANFSTGASFTNIGTVDVASGSTFTVGGRSGYTQTSGTTTVDGTLVASGTGVTVNGGTVLGAGKVGGSVSSNATVNVGDSGKSASTLRWLEWPPRTADLPRPTLQR
jgi:hypothetical protein